MEIAIKSLAEKGTINGKLVEVYEYNFFYGYDDPKGVTSIRKGTDKHGFLCYIDNKGGQWSHSDYNDKLYTACIDGVPVIDVPSHYWEMRNAVYGVLGLTYNGGGRNVAYKTNNKITDGEVVLDLNDKVKSRAEFKIGDRVFYARHYDSDTRNGDRWQIQSFIIRYIDVCCGEIRYYDYDRDVENFFSITHNSAREDECVRSVEELCNRFKGRTLYMWHSGGGCRIEPCNSTELFLRYNRD